MVSSVCVVMVSSGAESWVVASATVMATFIPIIILSFTSISISMAVIAISSIVVPSIGTTV